VGQAKRRHVLRYLAARECAGIDGTGPFDLDEALVRLDARLVKGCRWALAVAVELALTGQRPGCKTCAGVGTQPSRTEVVHGIDGRSYTMGIDFAACRACRGSGHNTSAQLPWPAWLRRKGGEFAAARLAPMREHIRPHWATRGFEATCENEVERRVETRTRSFPRGAHESRDPWQTLSATPVFRHWHHEPDGSRRPVWERHPPLVLTDEARWPAWLRGLVRHAEQRRERARRSAGKAEQPRRLSSDGRWSAGEHGAWLRAFHRTGTNQAEAVAQVEELLARRDAYSLGFEGGAYTLDESAAAGYAVQQRISGNSLGLASRLRVPLDMPPTRRNNLHDASAVTYSTPSTRTHWARDANRRTGRTQAVLEQAARHAGPVTVVAADELQVSMLRQRLRQLGAGHVQVCSVPSVVAGRLLGRSDLVLWDHYALERFPGVDPALYSRDAVAG
jgi:hypothetical protein